MRYAPPSDWVRIRTIEAHAAGEPLRVVIDGWPEIPGRTMLEKRRYAKEHHDHLRRALMWEPRGHADMYGAVLTDPVTPDGDVGVLFMHNEGYSTMCGHGVIALTTVLLETGMLPRREPETRVRLDTPAGRVTARARVRNGRVEAVAFQNVPSFVFTADQTVEVPDLGAVKFDIAFGGAYYAYCDATAFNIRLVPENIRNLIDVGMRIKHAVTKNIAITHPTQPDLGFLYGTILYGPPEHAGADLRNVCIFADGEVDRSPTGTGVSGHVARLYARGQLQPGQELVVESILGTRFIGRIKETLKFGPYDAVVPEVEGQAWLTGRAEYWIDPSDPLREGFFLR